ncbi:hypothetical protein DUI87_03551 [Hirundo rustica rustica]|uniref:Retroviral nucleocapsid Gag protein p24 C-terminal domain-containing protein n=1 Tax=Hirundo rustica rustica TaxID=333673 RepID=A0A3M0L0M6_HIRRU|nr:hypothetical protein DUI87_03551 [Hirundo rustica rustica]
MAVDNNNFPIQLEHLWGGREWISALKQAQEIRLLPSEPFVAFVERLTSAIELQVKEEGAQEQVLEEMALANANEQCKAAILSQPMEPAPALDDKLHVCARKVPFITAHQSHSSRVKSPQKAAAVDAMSPVPQPPPKRRMCLLCNQAGHWASQCTLKRQLLDFRDDGDGGISGAQREPFKILKAECRLAQRADTNGASLRRGEKKLENAQVELTNHALTSSAF